MSVDIVICNETCGYKAGQAMPMDKIYAAAGCT